MATGEAGQTPGTEAEDSDNEAARRETDRDATQAQQWSFLSLPSCCSRPSLSLAASGPAESERLSRGVL
jgi:hypothetical protein